MAHVIDKKLHDFAEDWNSHMRAICSIGLPSAIPILIELFEMPKHYGNY